MEILCDAKRKSPLRLSLWLDCPGWWQKMKVGCGEEGRGSLDILPAVNLPTSKKQSRTNSQCNREAILTFRFHILEFFFLTPHPPYPRNPPPWFLSHGSVSAALTSTKLNFCSIYSVLPAFLGGTYILVCSGQCPLSLLPSLPRCE